MAKFLNIFVASLGGGLALGAGIRLGEAIAAGASRRAGSPDQLPAGTTAATARDEAAPRILERMDRQHAAVEAMQTKLSAVVVSAKSAEETAGGLRDDLHRQLNIDLDRRIAEVENKLRLEMQEAQRRTVDEMLTSFETRVAPRIGRLERGVASQSEALTELRECSLQSERSIQRLVGVLEQVLQPKAGVAATGTSDPAEQPKLTVVAARAQ